MQLLILREEIICTIILVFLIFYYSINKVKDKEKLFLKLACFGLIHVVFDILTVITVNSMDTVPDIVNHGLHILFYLSGILFIMTFYGYVVHLIGFHRHMRKLRLAGYVPLVFFAVMLAFLPMEYVAGNGTYYSYGPLAFIGYGLFVLYCAACVIMLLMAGKRLDRRVKRSVIPMIIAMFLAAVCQALIPELLMTGGGIAFVCLGVFVALDNPDKDYKEQALWDFITGLKNRNCYNRDLDKYISSFKSRRGSKRIGFVVCDMNYLKSVNDIFGHAEGDRLISAAADALRGNLRSAENIYRIGGDEFVAIYLSPDGAKIAVEIENMKTFCKGTSGYAVPLRIAAGYCSGPIGDEESVKAVFDEADRLMYEDKKLMKQSEELPFPDRRAN